MNNRIAVAAAAVALVIGVLIGAAGTVLVGGTASRSPMDVGSMMGGSMMGGSMMGGSMMGGVDDMWQLHGQHHRGAR